MHATSQWRRIIHNGRSQLNLAVTDGCNFRCRHCMYSCTPNDHQWVTGEVLTRLRYWADFIEEHPLDPTENWCDIGLHIIGGEPTRNFNQFSRVIRWVDMEFFQRQKEVSMVTNGWWLRSRELSERFFSIVGCMVDSDGSLEESFRVTISNDVYHRECWGRHLPSRWDGQAEYLPLVRLLEQRLEECGMRCKEDYGWIHVDQLSERPHVTPVGRAQQECGAFKDMAYEKCYRGEYDLPTFGPDGKIWDICGCGGPMHGSIFEHPLTVLRRQDMLRQARIAAKVNCFNCESFEKEFHQRAKASHDFRDPGSFRRWMRQYEPYNIPVAV